MRLLGLLIVVLMTVLPVSARAQQSNPLANLVGTWVGGPTDSAYAPLNGMTATDTLILQPDSSYLWTRTTDGKSRKVMVNPQRPTDNHWKRLTSTNRKSVLNLHARRHTPGEAVSCVH